MPCGTNHNGQGVPPSLHTARYTHPATQIPCCNDVMSEPDLCIPQSLPCICPTTSRRILPSLPCTAVAARTVLHAQTFTLPMAAQAGKHHPHPHEAVQMRTGSRQQQLAIACAALMLSHALTVRLLLQMRC
jgi:hypothetical protein